MPVEVEKVDRFIVNEVVFAEKEEADLYAAQQNIFECFFEDDEDENEVDHNEDESTLTWFLRDLKSNAPLWDLVQEFVALPNSKN